MAGTALWRASLSPSPPALFSFQIILRRGRVQFPPFSVTLFNFFYGIQLLIILVSNSSRPTEVLNNVLVGCSHRPSYRLLPRPLFLSNCIYIPSRERRTPRLSGFLATSFVSARFLEIPLNFGIGNEKWTLGSAGIQGARRLLSSFASLFCHRLAPFKVHLEPTHSQFQLHILVIIMIVLRTGNPIGPRPEVNLKCGALPGL